MPAFFLAHILFQGANVNQKNKWTDMSPLHEAAFFHCTSVIAALLEHGRADVDITSSEFAGATPLHLAAFGMNQN